MEKKDNNDGKFPLIKIKIPKKAEEAAEEVKSHYCKECNKSFSSGKALGGHMSSAHVQANKDYSSSKKLSSKRKSPLSPNNTCDLCGKKFHSKKSLFGHMRCHPERDWRGMEPPPSIAAASSSEDDDDGEDHHVDSGRHELGFSLMGWPTSKRGRAAADSDKKEKEQPIVAGLQLLKMLNGESRKEEDDGPRITAVGGKGKEKVGPDRDFEIDPNDELVITAIQVLASGKRESEKPDTEEKLAPSSETTSSSPEKFKCSECERFFPTHQALGGHRSSHNKFKMSVVNTSTRPTNPQTPPSRRKEKLVKTNIAETVAAAAAEEAVFAFDLNVAPPAEWEDMAIGDSSNTTSSGS